MLAHATAERFQYEQFNAVIFFEIGNVNNTAV
jgi:hypothetical protein